MTERAFPFDAGPGSNVTEDQWSKMARLWRPNGIIRGAGNSVVAWANGSGMHVFVDTGVAWLYGYYYENDAAMTVAIDAADTQARIDRVVLRLDTAGNTFAAHVIKGTPAVSPAPPAALAGPVIWDLTLATVAVGVGAVVVASGDVTDGRTYADIDADTLDGHDSTYFAAGSSVPGADPGVPQAVAPDAAGSAGSSGEWSHGDHVHGLAVDVPSASHPGDAQALGSGPKVAFSDHVHAREADGTYDAATLETHNAAYFATATALGSEVTDRGNAVSSEATARSNADTTLQTHIDSEATARSNADTTLQTHIDSEATARSNADTAEAAARGTADNKRLKLIGATGSIGGTDPAVDGSVELLAQFGKGDITSDGVGGGFTFGFPVTFPNACIGVFLQNCSGTTAQQALIPIPRSATTTTCTGALIASDSGTPALSSTITLQWVAYGW